MTRRQRCATVGKLQIVKVAGLDGYSGRGSSSVHLRQRGNLQVPQKRLWQQGSRSGEGMFASSLRGV